MKFIIEYGNKAEDKLLIYIAKEHSFNMHPIKSTFDFELALNKLSLSVVNNRIVQLWGFCGLGKSMKSNYQAPKCKSGDLFIQDSFDFGFVYGINDDDLPVHVNTQTGWVCIGDPTIQNDAVEFINNCVAVINNENQFVALWLKPLELPNL